MSHTVYIMVQPDADEDVGDSTWWSVLSRPTVAEAIDEAEKIAGTLRVMGMEVERLDD